MLVSIFFTPFLKRRLPLILFSQLLQCIGGVVVTTRVLMYFAKPTVMICCSVLSIILRLSAALLPKRQQKECRLKHSKANNGYAPYGCHIAFTFKLKLLATPY